MLEDIQSMLEELESNPSKVREGDLKKLEVFQSKLNGEKFYGEDLNDLYNRVSGLCREESSLNFEKAKVPLVKESARSENFAEEMIKNWKFNEILNNIIVKAKQR